MKLISKKCFLPIFLTVIFLVCLIFFGGQVLAEYDDNANCAVENTDGDDNSFRCNQCSDGDPNIKWVSGGSWAFNKPECCGDDYGEYYVGGICVDVSSGWGTPIGECGYSINSSGNFYLIKDLNCDGTAITINADGVTFDGDGYTITSNTVSNGTGMAVYADTARVTNLGINSYATGIYVSEANGFTASGVQISADTGINFVNSSNGTVSGSGISSGHAGVNVFNSSGMNISSNTFTVGNTAVGVSFNNTNSSSFSSNSFAGAGQQVASINGDNNTVSGNSAAGYDYGISITGDTNYVNSNNISATYYGIEVGSGSDNYGCSNTVSTCTNCLGSGNYINNVSDINSKDCCTSGWTFIVDQDQCVDYDGEAPVVSDVVARCDSYTDTSTYCNDPFCFLTWTATDNVGVNNCFAEFDINPPLEQAGNDGQDNDQSTKQGWNTYYVRCVDDAGNISDVESDNLFVDTSDPQVNSFSGGEVCSGNNMTINWSVSDNGASSGDNSGIKQVELWKYAYGSWSEVSSQRQTVSSAGTENLTGTFTVTPSDYAYVSQFGIHVIDYAGREGTESTSGLSTLPSNVVSRDLTITDLVFSANPLTSGQTLNITPTVRNNGTGTIDADFNISLYLNNDFIESITVTDDFNSNTERDYTFSDIDYAGYSGNVTVEVKIFYIFSGSQDCDLSNNTYTASPGLSIVWPNLKINSYNINTATGQVTAKIENDGNDSVGAGTYFNNYSIDNNIQGTFEGQAISAGAIGGQFTFANAWFPQYGSHTLKVCTDTGLQLTESNENDNCQSSIFTISDTFNPVANSFSIDPTGSTCDTSIDVSWTVTDSGGSGLSKVEIFRNSVEVHEVSGLSGDTYTSSWTDNVACGSTYTYYIKVTDQAGNTVDNSSLPSSVSPVCGASAPASGSVSLNGSNLDLTWSSVTGATGYDLYRCNEVGESSACSIGGVYASDLTSTNYTDNTFTPCHNHRYWVKAKNACGVSSAKYLGSYYNSCSGPSISFDPGSRAVSQSDISIDVVVSEGTSSIDESKSKYCTTNSGTNCTPNISFNTNDNINIATDGEWYVCASIEDQNGLSDSACAGPYVRDTQEPNRSSVTASVSESCDVDADLTLSWTSVTDNGPAGIDHYEFYKRQKPIDDAWSDNWVREFITPDKDTLQWVDDGTFLCDYDYEYGVHAIDTAGNRRTEQTKASYTVYCPPVAPSNLSSSPGKNNIDWSWVGGTGVDGFEYKFDNASSFTATSNTSYEASSLNCNTSYDFEVRSTSDHCAVSDSVTASASTVSCGNNPVITFDPNSRINTPDDIVVTVNVNPQSGETISSKKYCKTNSGTSCVPGDTLTGSEVTIDTDGTWYICAWAEDSQGLTTTACSEEYKRDSLSPNRPDVSLNESSTCNINSNAPEVAWTLVTDNGVSGINRYEVFRRQDGGTWGIVHSTNDLTADSWQDDSSLECGHEYQYGIHVVDNAGNYSTENTPASYTVYCGTSAPSGITASSVGDTSADISWGASSNADSYDLYYCTGPACSRPSTANLADIAGTSQSLSGLDSCTTHRVWLEANSANCSDQLNNTPVEFTTSGCLTTNPDLIVETGSIDYSGTFCLGESKTVSANIKNRGNQAVAGNFDNTFSLAGIGCTENISGLGISSSQTITCDITPTATGSGELLTVTADIDGDISESNEGNNTLSETGINIYDVPDETGLNLAEDGGATTASSLTWEWSDLSGLTGADDYLYELKKGSVTVEGPAITTANSKQFTNLDSSQTYTLYLYANNDCGSSNVVSDDATTASGVTPDFTLTSNIPQTTIQTGDDATFILTLTPSGGFNSTVNLSCTDKPTVASCDFSNSSFNLNSETTITLTVSDLPNVAKLQKIFGTKVALAQVVDNFIDIEATGGGITRDLRLFIVVEDEPLPDLVIDSIDTDSNTYCIGETVSVSSSVKNQGEVEADNTQHQFKVNYDLELEGEEIDTLYNGWVSTPLAVDGSVNKNFTWDTSTGDLEPGVYNIEGLADTESLAEYQIIESAEGNNETNKTIILDDDVEISVWQSASSESSITWGWGSFSDIVEAKSILGSVDGPSEFVTSGNNTPNVPTNLTQTNGGQSVPEEGIIDNLKPSFSFNISDSDTGDNVGYQFQIAYDSAFTEITYNDYLASGASSASINFTLDSDLALGHAYYWRVRSYDGQGALSDWAYFGGLGTTDFYTMVLNEIGREYEVWVDTEYIGTFTSNSYMATGFNCAESHTITVQTAGDCGNAEGTMTGQTSACAGTLPNVKINSLSDTESGYICTGDTRTFEAEIANDGNSDIVDSFDNIFTLSDGLGSCTDSTSDLAMGATDTLTCALTIDTGLSDIALDFSADSANAISENNENDNNETLDLEVRADPDRIQNLSVLSANQTSITWTWDYLDTADSYFIWIDGAENEPEEVTNNEYSIYNLDCEEAHTIEILAFNECGFSDESVSLTSSTATCGAQNLPDLEWQGITAESNVCESGSTCSDNFCAGALVSIRAELENIGVADADTTGGYFETTGLAEDNQTLGTNRVSSLAVDETVNNFFTWDTNGLSAGAYTLTFDADVADQSQFRVTETNESNNSKQLTLNVVDCGSRGSGNASPNVSNLDQFDADGEMVESAETLDTNPYFTFDVSDSDTGDSVGYQYQLTPNCSDFDSQIINFTWFGNTTNPNSFEYHIPDDQDLSLAQYCWRVRAVDNQLGRSGWEYFGLADTHDFEVVSDYGVDSDNIGADFSYCRLEDNTLQFIDLSSGTGYTRSWDFGDGDTCPASCSETGYPGVASYYAYPVHTFSESDYDSDDFLWYSTMKSSSAITSPEVGSAGVIVGSPDISADGVNFDSNSEAVRFPITSFPDVGSVRVFFDPNYDFSDTTNEGYIFRADKTVGDYKNSIELKRMSYGNWYYKAERKYVGSATSDGNTFSCSLNVASNSWEADDYIDLNAKWNNTSAELYQDGVLVGSSSHTNCSKMQYLELDNTDMYIGRWMASGYGANGTIKNFMLFDQFAPTVTGGDFSSMDVTLTLTDTESNTYTGTRTIDFNDIPDCGFNWAPGGYYQNCSDNGEPRITLDWNDPLLAHNIRFEDAEYVVYYKSATEAQCAVDSGWTLAIDELEIDSYEKGSLDPETGYCFKVETDPVEPPHFEPLSLYVMTETCPLDLDSETIVIDRLCGSLTLGWDKVVDATQYKIKRSIGDNDFDDEPIFLTMTDAECDASTNLCDRECCYKDEQIIPTNTYNPDLEKMSQYYYHYILGVEYDLEGELVEEWLEPNEAARDFSYCYRAPNWQER